MSRFSRGGTITSQKSQIVPRSSDAEAIYGAGVEEVKRIARDQIAAKAQLERACANDPDFRSATEWAKEESARLDADR